MKLCSRHTEKAGGTDASLPVSLAKVVTGIIRSALGAGGCLGDDAKNVAWRVAIHSIIVSIPSPHPSPKNHRTRSPTYKHTAHPIRSEANYPIAR